MRKLQFGFKAFDPHELLCHFVAADAGLYWENSIEIELTDITFMPDSAIPRGLFQVSCGAALSGAIAGNDQRIIFVTIDKPMFWIYGAVETTSLANLGIARVATYPDNAPPHHLANMLMSKVGLDVQNAISLKAARDDVARLGLLQSESVEAAVISSALSPFKVNALGYKTLAFFGDNLSIPTTGLAVDEATMNSEINLLEDLRAILKQGLSIIHTDPGQVATVLEKRFGVNPDHSLDTAKLFQGCYTEDGSTSVEILENAIHSLGKALNVTSPPGTETLYPFN